MKHTDTLNILALMKPHERYMTLDDLTVAAWKAVLDANAPTMTYQFAQRFVLDWYGREQDNPLEAWRLVEAWNDHIDTTVREQLQDRVEALAADTTLSAEDKAAGWADLKAERLSRVATLRGTPLSVGA
jgi:hypothetical protein